MLTDVFFLFHDVYGDCENNLEDGISYVGFLLLYNACFCIYALFWLFI